jgi:fumarate reductase subunit C
VWTDHFWPLYIVLLLAVEIHGGVGLYRLAVKWGWLQGADAKASRRRLATAKWLLTAFFVVLGLFTLAAYMKIGYAHKDHVGEPYVPAAAQMEKTK